MAGQSITLYDQHDAALGTFTNPLVVTSANGGGSGTASTVTTYPGAGAAAIEASSIPLAPPAAATLLSTLSASAARAGYWFFENQSPNVLSVVLDDGNGNALSVFTLGAAPADGGQGGTMGSNDTGPHLGRIRVYGAANSHHSLRAQ